MVRIFWIDKANKKVKVVREVNLTKDEMTALPDSPDYELQ